MYQQESLCSNLSEELITGGTADPQEGETSPVAASQRLALPMSGPGAPLLSVGGQTGITLYPSAVSGPQIPFIRDQLGPEQ